MASWQLRALANGFFNVRIVSLMLLRCAKALRRRLVPQLSRVLRAADAQLQ
jgi:hypothetical protein